MMNLLITSCLSPLMFLVARDEASAAVGDVEGGDLGDDCAR